MRFLLLATLVLASCGKAEAGPAGLPAPGPAAPRGTIEVTAKLVEVPGTFPANKLYDYVYVLKYKVLAIHRGKIEGSEILVGQYNPLKARSTAQDKFSGTIGGTAQHFSAGDVQRLSLEEPLDSSMPMVGLIDKYLKEKGVRYWAVWTDEVRE
ncbi:MAG TPA: hypothetical protein VMU54_24070 [Planctomycetota bacterium]|nr:hypothetical protein [Planctomycetota bacterium]